MKILITGGNGFVAKEINKYLESDYEVHCLGKEQLNLLNKTSIHRRALEFYDVVINTAVVGGNRKDVDDKSVFCDNMLMIENLLSSLSNDQMLIHFTSGAEFRNENTAYGLAKKISTRLVNARKNTYNLRLYGCFGADEIDKRFIKRCFNCDEIVIADDMEFDFFYVQDVARVCKFLIDGGLSDNKRSDYNERINDIDCVYAQKYKLSDVANIIKSKYKPELEVIIGNPFNDEIYTGDSRQLQNLETFFKDKLVGLEKGLEAMNAKN
jgi:GDP-L-fucose synthase